MDKEELRRRFEAYLADQTAGSNVVDLELRKAVAALGLSVLKLDDSSTRLWRISIVLTVVILLVALVQVGLMVRCGY